MTRARPMAPGTPPVSWIEQTCRILPASAHMEARAISNLIEKFGTDRLLNEDIGTLLDLYHVGLYKQRGAANRRIALLKKYRDALVGGTAATAGSAEA